MAQTFTLSIPAGHIVHMIDQKGRSKIINLAGRVVIENATLLNPRTQEYRYDLGEHACTVHAKPLCSDSRVSVSAN